MGPLTGGPDYIQIARTRARAQPVRHRDVDRARTLTATKNEQYASTSRRKSPRSPGRITRRTRRRRWLDGIAGIDERCGVALSQVPCGLRIAQIYLPRPTRKETHRQPRIAVLLLERIWNAMRYRVGECESRCVATSADHRRGRALPGNPAELPPGANRTSRGSPVVPEA